jgi:hypothetical protein
MCNVLSLLSTALGLAMDMIAPNPRPGGRRRAAAWAAWPAAGIVLALMAVNGPAGYAAGGTAPPAPSLRSGTPPAPHKMPKKTEAPCGNLPYSGPTWMHDIAPCLEGRRLSDIAIPGSHDSGTFAFDFFEGGGFATTQDEDYTHQLDDGMRQFDIRVEYRSSGDSGPGFYLHHGTSPDIISHWLTLTDIFAAIAQWANVPGHQNEIIILDLSIVGGDDQGDCYDFGQAMGDALLTPQELLDNFGTTDPGEVTPGQLWSRFYTGAALVIMKNISCLEEAKNAETLPEWGDSGGYYADQCTFEGISGGGNQSQGLQKTVLPAAEHRYNAANGIPEAFGPPEPEGHLYELSIQATPEGWPPSCWKTPKDLLPYEQDVLPALFFPGVAPNLNIVAGDYVEQTDLLKDVIAQDQLPRAPIAPKIANLTPGEGQATVDFTEPDGGTAPVTSYTVTVTDYVHPSRTVSGDISPITVTGLTNGVENDVTMTATNDIGTSPPSAIGVITPGVPPKFVGPPAATGIVGRPYTSQFVFNGAPPPIVRLVYGSNPPPGLTLDTAGVLTGTPKEAGTYTFTVKAWSPLGIPKATATITISNGVTAEIEGCSPQGGNVYDCALQVTLPPLAVNQVFSVGIGGAGFANPNGGARPQVTGVQGCQTAPLPSPYYPGNGGYSRYDVNISTGGCTAGAVVTFEEAVMATAGATITQSVTVPGLPTSTDTFVLPPPGEPGSASPSPTAERDRARHRGTASRDAVRDHKPDLR